MRFLGTGSAVPSSVLTNDMLSEMVDTSDEWIRTRTGIRERRIVKDQNAYDLTKQAAEAAIAAAEQDPRFSKAKIAVVICASIGSKENYCPSLACNLQRELGLPESIFAFDLNAACSGFIYSLIAASRFIGPDKFALVVGCDVLSQFVDFSDRTTCVLFGDGAGAAVIAPNASLSGNGLEAEEDSAPVLNAPPFVDSDFHWVTQAKGSDMLKVQDHIHMDGQSVFKFAVDALVRHIRSVLASAKLNADEVDLFICHQANERILSAAARRLGVPLERFFMNLAKYGNTSAGSVPLALDEAVREGALRSGMRLVLAGFGGGMTAGAISLTWN